MLPEFEAQDLVMKPLTEKKRFCRTDSCDSADGTLPSKWLKSVLPLIQGTMCFERLFRTWTSVSIEDPRRISPRAETHTRRLGCVVGANTVSLSTNLFELQMALPFQISKVLCSLPVICRAGCQEYLSVCITRAHTLVSAEAHGVYRPKAGSQDYWISTFILHATAKLPLTS